MKKIISLLLSLVLSLTLVGCLEITEEFNKEQLPSIDLVHEGELYQIYDESNTLENVTYTVIFNKFLENGISLEAVAIHWYVGNVRIYSVDNQTTYEQVVNSPGAINVKVIVSFVFEDENKELEANSLINVFKEATKINVTNSVDSSTHNISITLGDNNQVEFLGIISGNLKVTDLNWLIFRRQEQTLDLFDQIKVTETEVINNNLITKLNYSFKSSGSYVVRLQTGTNINQDANNIISNTTHVTVNVGEFEIKSSEQRIMSKDYSERTLTINGLDEKLVGKGVYKWYLNGQEIDNDNNFTFTHTNTDLGGYVYQVKFYPIIKAIPEPVITEPFLIVNGKLVNDENEFLNALENNQKGIILNNNIVYQGEKTITLNENTAIYGNGNQIKSMGLNEFFKIKGDNVVMANLKVVNSNKYSIHVELSENAYFEDLKMSDFSGTSDLLSGDFSAGLYIDRSSAVVKNIEFLTGGLVGIRLEQHLNIAGVTKLRLYGSFSYNNNDPLMLPIGSAKSDAKGIELVASGFDSFVLPGGEITIRRWDNQGEPIGWEIYDPFKTVYYLDEGEDFLDLHGIGIKIDISFLELEFASDEGLAFVKLFIEMFGQYGILEITSLDDKKIFETYYIVGDLNEPKYGLDQLFYSKDKELYKNNKDLIPEKPLIPTEKGDYKLKIYIGEEFYLGHIIITVK